MRHFIFTPSDFQIFLRLWFDIAETSWDHELCFDNEVNKKEMQAERHGDVFSRFFFFFFDGEFVSFQSEFFNLITSWQSSVLNLRKPFHNHFWLDKSMTDSLTVLTKHIKIKLHKDSRRKLRILIFFSNNKRTEGP